MAAAGFSVSKKWRKAIFPSFSLTAFCFSLRSRAAYLPPKPGLSRAAALDNPGVFDRLGAVAELNPSAAAPSVSEKQRQCQTSQQNRYPVLTATSVKGMPMRMKSPVLTSYPSLRRMPMAAMFADAPMGVRLPPSVAPVSKPK